MRIGGNIMSETKAESKIMDTLIEETEEIMEYEPYDEAIVTGKHIQL